MITDDFLSIIDLIDESGGYVLCPGMQPDWYEETYKTAGYQRDKVREFQLPTKRYESIDCLLWHKPCNRYAKLGDNLYNVCSNCKQEGSRALQNAERSLNVDETVKDARRSPSSNYPMAKLSPSSQSEKVKRLKKENKINHDKLQKLLEKSSELSFRK